MSVEKSLIDILWVLVCSGLVLIMQGGFLVLESGLTRAKNSINVAIKNVADFGVATLLFYTFGFGLMFGMSWNGIIGTNLFSPDFPAGNAWPPTFFLFQLVFCGTSATIVSGAVAERLKFQSYLIATALISGIIYPIAGHWCWGGSLSEEQHGWLAMKGFHDFAGSTLVHSVGGWVSLALLIVVGPRIGRFPENESPKQVTGSNLPMAMLGGILLWFGWMGFNGGSTLGFNEKVPGIILNTIISSGFSMTVAMLIAWVVKGFPEATAPLNGSLAGLVAITAGADCFTPTQAALIGSIAGSFVLPAEKLLERWKIDDAVGAIPVHLVGGIWGTVAVGLFGNLQLIDPKMDRLTLLGIQFLGIFSVGAFAFGLSWLVFYSLNRFSSLRVDGEEERMGLNISEHKATTELIDLFLAMDYQRKTGDLGTDVPVEPFTEVGQIAERYNLVLGKVRTTLSENEKARTEIAEAYDRVRIEQDKAEKLLLNVLPESIAQELKSKASSSALIADSYPNVSILFADIVEFTRLSASMKPESVVRILNEVFSHFDTLAEKYSLEKIKTIGDAYMAVGGLPIPNEAHPLLVAHMAWEMNEILSRFRLKKMGTKLRMRIGINTGPVVAGVIGTKKFIYDIWGDAVNLASRMESHGVAGEIQVTESTADLIRSDFALTERGKIEVKGKGLVKTYLISHRLRTPEESLPGFGYSLSAS
ncbi:ammonium transporter [Leptospira wolffii]|uniref:ammonium transporter n=1 Tax=Leptospira wolffii TaxID=409998 RepID=UPI0010848837|nr:ammonium transporter [Leptospira wolffii]TGK61683.1 ammonium transporter [Leptospira wolffii]TGK70227.1 ammonium transporter [Leptospira wolffii]TGK77150.1 ammonium transporter [Leptospira wolffii]TGL30998.1 ammonium transporter [Leptospira wolffii]